MRTLLLKNIAIGIFSLIVFSAFSQTAAQILIDGGAVYISPTTKFPLWLETGHSIAPSTNVVSISAIEYNITTSPAGGKILTLSQVKYITGSYTVQANQTLKVEGVMLNPAVSGAGTQWLVGGNTAPGSPVIGSVDNSPVSLQSGTGTLGVGADPASKTVNVGNSTGATTVNVNTGTGGYNLTTGSGGSATTTLGTGGNAVFGSATANADKIAIQPQTTSAATNTGTVTSADLTGARTYTLPDASGTVAVSATGNIALSGAGNITLTGTVPSTNGGTGVSNAGTITNASNTTITGGGTLGLGGNTLTVPATGTAALGTGNTNYNTYWSGTNTLAAEQYTSAGRGGLGADMTAGAIGAIPYSTSTTAYGTLADVAAGSYLRSGGVGAAPVWSTITLPNAAATGDIWYASGTNTIAALARNATQGTILMNNSAGTPTWTTLASLPSTSGIIPPANLGTGTLSSTTFLNGTGTFSVPSVTLSGGTNTALTYWNSTTTLGAATGGSGMYWDNSTGRMGIGITTPLGPLTVGSSLIAAVSDGHIVIGKSTGGGGNRHMRMGYDAAFNFVIGDYGNNNVNGTWVSQFAMHYGAPANSLTINSSGYVGMGVASASKPLEIALAGGIRISRTEGLSANNEIFFQDNGQIRSVDDAHRIIFDRANNILELREYGDLIFSPGASASNRTQTVTMKSGGNVGMGLTNPGATLTIRQGGTDPGTYDDGKALFVSSGMNPGTSFDGGVEFRHDNLSQGVGFGYQSIYATGFNTNQALNVYSRGTDPLTLNAYGGGNVGLGTNNPTQAKFVVVGSVNYNITARYYNSGGANGGTTAVRALSAYFDNMIATSELQVFSDARTKNVIGLSDSKKDLNTLMSIGITDYKFIDTIGKGTGINKKVIAQQVKSVYPQAVNVITSAVPDIYQPAEICNGRVNVKNNLKVGEKVQLMIGSRSTTLAVLQADANGFNVDSKEEGDIFVYGREVNDFHMVDYEALSTLNISATQELARKIAALEKENAELKNENCNVKTNNEELYNMMKNMKTQLDLINERLNIKSER